MFIKNKVVVIVGGSKGIGKGLYDVFIDKDCIVHSISRKNCDITNPDQIDSYFNKLDSVNEENIETRGDSCCDNNENHLIEKLWISLQLHLLRFVLYLN